jgi:T5SS/PEP-CTERM-associated repeat protein
MNRFKLTILAVAVMTGASAARGAISSVGDVVPDPLTWTASTTSSVGNTGFGSLTVNGGSDLVSYDTYIGHESGSTGEVTIDGASSTWDVRHQLFLGYEGNCTLNITAKGKVITRLSSGIAWRSGATGIVTVDGADSLWEHSGWLGIGNGGSGTLNIQNDGAFTNNDTTFVHSSGEIHFENNGTMETGTLYASPANLTGKGTLTTRGLVSDVDLVFDSPASLNQTFTLNSNPGQNISVNLNMVNSGADGWLGIGFHDHGSLMIRNGITLTSYISYIAYGSGSTGVATVEGTDSRWETATLLVGDGGTGHLNIINGGTVSTNTFATSTIGNSGTGGTSEITVDGAGSSWLNSSKLSVGDRGSGAMNILNGGKVSNTSALIGEYSGSNGEVTVDGAGSTWTNNGSLYVGRQDNGMLTITGGGMVSVGGTLTIDYNGGGDGFINMATGGMLALFGDADESLFDFLGLINGTDAIRYWNDSISDWFDITGATFGDDYTLSYLSDGDLDGYTLLTVGVPESATRADFDGDGDVDSDDLLIWNAYFGLADPLGRPVQEIGDADEDSDIDGNDFLIWQREFHGGFAASVASASVPEPGSRLLVAVSLALCLMTRISWLGSPIH